MTKEDKKASEMLTDEELDKVAGGMMTEYPKNPPEIPPGTFPINSPEVFPVKSIDIVSCPPIENKSGEFLTPERMKELDKVLNGEQSK